MVPLTLDDLGSNLMSYKPSVTGLHQFLLPWTLYPAFLINALQSAYAAILLAERTSPDKTK